ncbi:MAG TPA: metallophosphoesterase [Vicinamibacterales bacterium]|jgi:Icc-related predicted phosphoesterase
MPACFFASDLHGRIRRYNSLIGAIEAERPAGVFLGGDLLPSGFGMAGSVDPDHLDFINGFLAPQLERLHSVLGRDYPDIFVILGNDDPRAEEAAVLDAAARGVWHYVHDCRVEWRTFDVYGYACVPPTPFRLKDWERYDVSRFVDPGCLSPEEGWRSIPVPDHVVRYGTIQGDLELLVGDRPVDRAIMLFHSPPYKTVLDRAALDGVTVDYAPVDVHVGSIAVQRFLERRQPLVTLHGHVHESARLTGEWRTRLGETQAFSAAHDGPELALVRFDPEHAAAATRELI